jgi:hypothetical protein
MRTAIKIIQKFRVFLNFGGERKDGGAEEI